jgi:hypothetical protein
MEYSIKHNASNKILSQILSNSQLITMDGSREAIGFFIGYMGASVRQLCAEEIEIAWKDEKYRQFIIDGIQKVRVYVD